MVYIGTSESCYSLFSPAPLRTEPPCNLVSASCKLAISVGVCIMTRGTRSKVQEGYNYMLVRFMAEQARNQYIFTFSTPSVCPRSVNRLSFHCSVFLVSETQLTPTTFVSLSFSLRMSEIPTTTTHFHLRLLVCMSLIFCLFIYSSHLSIFHVYQHIWPFY